jgi:hypothetical protein
MNSLSRKKGAGDMLRQLLHGDTVLQMAHQVAHTRRIADIMLMEEAAEQAVLAERSRTPTANNQQRSDEKSPAELQDELMRLFREAKAIGAVVEVDAPRHAWRQARSFHSSFRQSIELDTVLVSRHAWRQARHFHSSFRQRIQFDTFLVSRHAWRQAPDFRWPFLLRRGAVPGPRPTLKGLVAAMRAGVVGLTVALGVWRLGAWSG